MPSFIERFKEGYKVFRRGYPAKQQPYIWPSWRMGRAEWQLVDIQAYTEEGYAQNSLIYSAIMYKVRAGTTAPIRAYKGDPEEKLPPNHPLAQLLQRPNPYQSFTSLQALNEVYLNIAGNCYIGIDRGKLDIPEGLYTFRPDRVYIIPGDPIKGYMYVPEGKGIYEGIPFLPEDMMHVKLPNPLDPLEGLGYGLSPIAPMARSADVDNKITEFLKIFFDRGTVLNGLLKFDTPMTPDTVARVRERWKEIYGGYTNWDEIGILDQGGEYQKMGYSFDEMGFDALDERNEARLLGPFGVPLTLIPTRSGMKGATYNNKREDRQMFWQDTMVPELKLFEDEYQYYLQSSDGGYVRFDLSRIPALTEVKLDLIEAWTKLVERGVPKNLAAETVGLELGDLPDGDTAYMPVNLVPVGASLPEQESTAEMTEAQEDTRKSLPGPENKSWTPEQKKALWKQVDRTARSWEPAFKQAAQQAFKNDQAEILALLNSAKAKALQEKATIAWQELLLSWKDYFTMAGENWREAFVPVVMGVIQDQGQKWAAELGFQFDIRNILAEQWFDDYFLTFAQPILETTEKDLSALLQTAQKEGWSIPQMQNAINLLFEEYLNPLHELNDEQRKWFIDRLPRYRLELISRVETLRSSNVGSFNLFKSWGVKKKEWLATFDPPRARESHMVAGTEYMEGGKPGPIPIDQPFVVDGEQMMYPHDPAASIGNVANCRCTVLPYLEDKR